MNSRISGSLARITRCRSSAGKTPNLRRVVLQNDLRQHLRRDVFARVHVGHLDVVPLDDQLVNVLQADVEAPRGVVVAAVAVFPQQDPRRRGGSVGVHRWLASAKERMCISIVGRRWWAVKPPGGTARRSCGPVACPAVRGVAGRCASAQSLLNTPPRDPYNGCQRRRRTATDPRGVRRWRFKAKWRWSRGQAAASARRWPWNWPAAASAAWRWSTAAMPSTTWPPRSTSLPAGGSMPAPSSAT